MPASVRDIVALLDQWYDPRRAADWDSVGTSVGDLDAPVERMLLAVDPVQAVADEAVAREVQLILTHHPLYLRGTSSVSTATPKGRVVHTLSSHGIALHTCHTNADTPPAGVSEAMAITLGLAELTPLDPTPEPGLDKWVVFVPAMEAQRVADAMHRAGAGRIGNYDRAQFQSRGQGSFRPTEGANPSIGHVGAVQWVEEKRVEMVADPACRAAIRAAMIEAHPYEEPAHDVWTLAATPGPRGTGRVGTLAEPMTLAVFAERVRQALPAHHGATRVAGDLDRPVRTVALCGGSGDSLLGVARASGADVYVTSDLRHHLASEHLEYPGACALIDVPHWAAEWTWLPVVAERLRQQVGVDVHVSTVVTDPWSATLTSRSSPS